MTAKFPTEKYTQRDLENLPGISYDATKKQNLFAEDILNLALEIIAIETYLLDWSTLPTSDPHDGKSLWLNGGVLTLSGESVVATPLISPNGGSFSDPTDVTLACATSGADIYYTTNGATPTTGDTLYTVPFSVSVSETVKAKAFHSGMADSAVASAVFTISIVSDFFHWLLNELSGTDVVDVSANPQNGIASEDVSAIAVAGKINGAFDFEDSSRVDIPNTDGQFDTPPFSIAFWCKNWSGHGLGNDGQAVGWRFEGGGGNIHFCYATGGAYPGTGSVDVGDGNWHHIVVTVDAGGNFIFYTDDAVTDSGQYNWTSSSSDNLQIGSIKSGAYGPFSGALDDVRVYKKILTQGDVDFLWNGGAGTESELS